MQAVIVGEQLHLQHGPIDLLISVDAPIRARLRAFEAATLAFENLLDQLVSELPVLRAPLDSQPSTQTQPVVTGPVAKRMVEATIPYRLGTLITPMAAVAGAVADEIGAAIARSQPSIALRSTPPESEKQPASRGRQLDHQTANGAFEKTQRRTLTQSGVRSGTRALLDDAPDPLTGMGFNPIGPDPAGLNPAGINPAGPDPAGLNPVSPDRTNFGPAICPDDSAELGRSRPNPSREPNRLAGLPDEPLPDRRVRTAQAGGHGQIQRWMVNNGGDIALWLGPEQQYRAGLVTNPTDQLDLAKLAEEAIVIHPEMNVGGIATSGWRGRSFSRGIADSVTVLAPSAAAADAAATLIANEVNLEGHPHVLRERATDLDSNSDLGECLVTTEVGHLTPAEITKALRLGLNFAEKLCAQGTIVGAALHLSGTVVSTVAPTSPTGALPDGIRNSLRS